MIDNECIHGFEPAWCSCCLHGPTKEPARPEIDGAPFPARKQSRCGGCDGPVIPGDMIVRLTTGYYRHPGCV